MGYARIDMDAAADVVSSLMKCRTSLDEVSDEIWSIAGSVSKNETLNHLGYAAMIREAGSAVERHATDTMQTANTLSSVIQLYRSYEDRVIQASGETSDAGNAIGAVIKSPALGFLKRRRRPKSIADYIALLGAVPSASLSDAFKKGLDETIESLRKAPGELTDLFERFRFWRSSKGSEMVQDVYRYLGEKCPPLKNLFEGIVDDYNKKLTNYENMVVGVLNPTNIDALARGGKAFADEVGVGWIAGVGKRLKKQTDFYVERGAKQIAEGHVAKGILTGIGGPLVAFGDMVVDTTVKTAKMAAKKVPVIGTAFKVANGVAKALSGSTVEELVDKGIGSIGNGIKSFLEWATR